MQNFRCLQTVQGAPLVVGQIYQGNLVYRPNGREYPLVGDYFVLIYFRNERQWLSYSISIFESVP